MRIAAIALILCAGVASAHAETWETRDTVGLDVTTLWEPRRDNAFGAGPLLRVEGHTSQLPSWLDIVTRGGITVDSADRVLAPIALGLLVRGDMTGPYGSLEGGGMFGDGDAMLDNSKHLEWTASVAAGWRVAHWDVRATLMRGGFFDGNAWLFSIGRDFARIDSTVTETDYF